MELVPLAAVRDLRTGDPLAPGSITMGHYLDEPYFEFDIENNEIVVHGTLIGGGGTPGGADTQIQYNNGGAFGGDATFLFDDASKLVTANALTLATGDLTMTAGDIVLADESWIGTSSGNAWLFDTAGDISTTANVGVGRTDPVEEVDVVGSIYASENFRFNDTNLSIAIGKFAEGEALSQVAAMGYYAGYRNTGAYQSAFGYLAGYQNTGTHQSAFGYLAGRQNTGVNQSAFGSSAGRLNTGVNQFAFGASSGRYNDGDNNTSLGNESFNTFTDDAGSAVTFDFGDVDVANDQITIVGHGLGATDSYLNLRFAQGTLELPGIANASINLCKIISADIIEIISDTITGQGTGTGHTLTPQYIYSNSTAIGYNAEPDASNQMMLGDANLTEVKTTAGLNLGGNITLADEKWIGTSSSVAWIFDTAGDISTAATVTLDSSLYIKEGSDGTDVAGYGQLYCKDNAGTTELWFVNDAGTETQLA